MEREREREKENLRKRKDWRGILQMQELNKTTHREYRAFRDLFTVGIHSLVCTD